MTTTEHPADLRVARRRFVLVGVVWPVLVTAVGAALMLAWLPQLPDPVAIHWNASGVADGFAPAWVAIVLAAALGVGLTALFAIPVLLASRTGEWGATMRFLGAVNAGMSTYLVLLVTWSLAMQRGLADAHDAPSIVPGLIVGLCAGLVVGVAAWFIQPRVHSSGGRTSPVRAAERIVLAPGERAMWMRSAMLPAAGMLAIVGMTIALAVATLWGVFGGIDVWPWLAVLALAFLAMLLTTSVFRVRVDDEGLTVRSPLGIPRFRVPLDDITAVEIATVTPMADFGGWGIRSSIDGRFGIVLRGGEAIQVTRRSGRRFVVTVDDAVTGAALLEALRERSRRNPV